MRRRNKNTVHQPESHKRLPRMLAPAAAALLLTAACGSRPTHQSGKTEAVVGPAPTATASLALERAPYTPLTPEQQVSQRNLATQAEVNTYAARVLELSKTVKGASEHRTITGGYSKEVIIKAPGMLHDQTGEMGEYYLSTSFAADANGKLDPTNPTSIHFTSIIHSPTEGDVIQYQLGIEQSVSGGNWDINVLDLGATDNGIPKSSYFTTGSETEVISQGKGAVPAADPTSLNRLRAEFDRLENMAALAEQGSVICPPPPLVEMREA